VAQRNIHRVIVLPPFHENDCITSWWSIVIYGVFH
jgi:hypothetical protein